MKIPQFFKRRSVYIGLPIVLLLVLGGFFLFRGKSAAVKTVTAQIGNIQQVISGTGQVTANDKVDISFAGSGRVSGIYSSVGKKVYTGQIIAKLDSADLNAQLQSASASAQAAQARLDQLISGARDEDINVLKTSLDNAKNVLTNASARDSLAVSRNALNTAINSLVTVSDLQKKYGTFLDGSQNERIIDKKERALFVIYEQPNLGRTDPWYFLSLQSGLPLKLSAWEIDSSFTDGIQLLSKIKSVLFVVQEALDSAHSGINSIQSTDAEKSSIVTAKTSILGQITAIIGQEQAIANAQNNVASLQSQMDLKKAPPTQYDLEITKSQLAQAQASQAQIQAQIEKNIIRSPINGVIADLDLRVGEIASPGKTAVSIIGINKFQIESNIPEADVAKIKVGNPVKVTLDAYGPDIVWDATVSQIYPAEKIIEGVPTYKTIIALDRDDELIKSGMTANLDIKNESKQNVLYLPQRSIIRKDGKKFVKLLLPNNYAADSRFANINVTNESDDTKTAEIEIQTGFYGTDGRVEILSGLKEGDKIITE